MTFKKKKVNDPRRIGFSHIKPNSVDELLAVIEALPKDSDEFKRLRRKVYGKVIVKEANPKLLAVFQEAVKLYGFEQVRLGFLQVKREQPEKEKKPSSKKQKPAQKEDNQEKAP